MSRTKDWIQAARPLAQINIAAPLLLGQVAAWHVTARFHWLWCAAALLWGVLDHLFVIFANDFADRESDTGRRTRISGGSGIIQEGRLAPSQVGRAARLAAIALLLYSGVLAFVGRPWTPAYALAALLLMWLYSFAPVRLSYRGGGELLQGIGIGIGLPSLGYYLQAEGAFAPGWVMGPAVLLGVCSNVLTAVPDVEDDAIASKNTWPVRNGVPSARRFGSGGIAFAAVGVFVSTPGVSVPAKAVVAFAPLLPLLVAARSADPFRAAWWSSIALNMLVAFWMLAMISNL